MIERLQKDGADIQWLQSGYSKGDALAPLSNAMALSRYRVEIDNLFRQVRLRSGKGTDIYKPEIDAYAVIDHDERFVDLTGSIEAFLGYDKNALFEVGLASVVHPDDYASMHSALQQKGPGDDILSFHSRFKTATGAYINVEWCMYIKSKPMSELHDYAIILRRAGS